MTAPGLLLDTSVLVYAVGGDHPLREPARRIVARAGDTSLFVSVLSLQEFLHQRVRRGEERSVAAGLVAQVMAWSRVVDLLVEDVRFACSIQARVDGLDAADACIAATALRVGCGPIVTADQAFGRIDGVERLSLEAAAAMLG